MQMPEEIQPIEDLPASEVLSIEFKIPPVDHHNRDAILRLERDIERPDNIKKCHVGNWNPKAFCLLNNQTYIDSNDKQVTRTLFLHANNLIGVKREGRRPIDIASLPKELYFDTKTIESSERGHAITKAYTEEEYVKIKDAADSAKKELEEINAKLKTAQEVDEAFQKVINSPELRSQLQNFADQAASVTQDEQKIDIDGRDVSIKFYESLGSVDMDTDGTPIVTRKISISSDNFIEGNNTRTKVDVEVKVKGWKGFEHNQVDREGVIVADPKSIAFSRIEYSQEDNQIVYGVKYKPSGATTRISCQATIHKPEVSRDSLIQVISGKSRFGKELRVIKEGVYTPDLNPRLDRETMANPLGSFEMQNEIALVDSNFLSDNFDRFKLNELGKIPEIVTIKEVNVGEVLTRAYIPGSPSSFMTWRDDSEPSFTMIQRRALIHLEIEDLPSTVDSFQQYWSDELFKVTNFGSLNPDDVRRAVEVTLSADYRTYPLIRYYDNLTDQGKKVFAENYPEKDSYLKSLSAYCKQLPDKIAEAVSQKVTLLEDIEIVTEGAVPPEQILGYTIYTPDLDKPYHWSGGASAIQIMPTTQVERDAIKAGDRYKGMFVSEHSRIVPIVKKGSGIPKAIPRERVWMVPEPDNDYFFNQVSIEGEKYADYEPTKLVEDLKRNIEELLVKLPERLRGDSEFRNILKYTGYLLEEDFVPQEVASRENDYFQNKINVSLPVLEGRSLFSYHLDLLPKTGYKDGDLPGIFPPFNNNFESRYRIINKLKEYLRGESYDADLYGIDKPDDLRVIVSQMEALLGKVVEFQDKITGEIFTDLKIWNELAKKEKNGTWFGSDSDALPNEDTQYRIDELETIDRDITAALNCFGDQIQGRSELGYFNSIPDRKNPVSLDSESYHKLHVIHQGLLKKLEEKYEKEFDVFDNKEPLEEGKTFSGTIALGDEKMEPAWQGGPEVDKRERFLTISVPTTTFKTIKEPGRLASRTIKVGIVDKPQKFDGYREIKFDAELKLSPGNHVVTGVVLNEGRGKGRSNRLYFQILSLGSQNEDWR